MQANRYKPFVFTKPVKNTTTRRKRVVKGVLVNNNSMNDNIVPAINTNNNAQSVRSNASTSSAEKKIFAENARVNFGFVPTYARSTNPRKKTRNNRSPRRS